MQGQSSSGTQFEAAFSVFQWGPLSEGLEIRIIVFDCQCSLFTMSLSYTRIAVVKAESVAENALHEGVYVVAFPECTESTAALILTRSTMKNAKMDKDICSRVHSSSSLRMALGSHSRLYSPLRRLSGKNRTCHTSLDSESPTFDKTFLETFALTKHNIFHSRNIDIPYDYIDNTVGTREYRWEPMQKHS